MSSDPTLNPDYPLYGFDFIGNDNNGDLYRKTGQFCYLFVKYVEGKREGKAEMKLMGKEEPICILTYSNDKLNGKCTRIDDDGHKLIYTLKDDVLDGPFSEYDEKGSLLCQGEYKNGIRVKEEFPSSSKKAAGVAAGVGAGVATAAATGAIGAAAALLGFGSPGIIGGSVAASAMSAAWTSGLGTGLVSAAQSAGALFMNAVGGSYLAATAAVAAPVAVGGAVGYGIYRLLKRNQ